MANQIDLSFYQSLFYSSPDGIAVYDPALKCIMLNSAGCEILHVTEEEALNKTMEELVPGIEETPRYEQYKETLETGKSFSISFSKTVGLEEQHITVNTRKIGENIVLFVSDITSSIKKHDSLMAMHKAKTSEFNPLLFGIASQVFFKDQESKYTSVNQACADFFCLDPVDMIGKTAADIMTKEEACAVAQEDRKILTGEVTILSAEAPRVSAKGDVHWFSSTILPLKSNDNTIVGLVGISFDITQKKITEMELGLLATAVYQTGEAIVITDPEGNIQYVNPAFEKITGYSAEEAIGKNPSFLSSGKCSNTFYTDLWETIKKGKTWHGHFFNRKKDGSFYEEEADISPVIMADGEVSNFIAVKRDVSKEMTLENQLKQSQKMEAIGRLAGGIAHDFNNILTAILGYTELLLASMDNKDPLYRNIDEIRKAGMRATTLTKQMLAFSKKQIVQHKSLSLNETLNGLEDMLKRIIGENINLEFNLDPKLDFVLSDKGQIEQIIVNLLVNAKDAVSDSEGEVSIDTSNVYLKEGFSDGNFDSPPGAYVLLKVKDNGCGIPEENLQQIFEPFFSKENESTGTAFGLSTVYAIVKQHKGFIDLESHIGSGTTFNIYLPSVMDEVSSPEEDTAMGGVFTTGSGLIMIVEDEPLILELATSIVEFGGYTVIPCLSAEDALEKFNKVEHELILLITDLVLGGMRGDELAVKLREKKPDLKVLYMSGYVGEVDIQLTLDKVHTDFIEKPFSMEKLSSTINQLLTMKD